MEQKDSRRRRPPGGAQQPDGTAATAQAVRRRGRPRSFDVGQATDRAAAVFWQNGYAAASLDDIAAATGLYRPSLAAAFGDKRRLYLQALARYREVSRGPMADAFAKPTLRAALQAFYAHALSIYLPGSDGARPLGCFVIGTAVTEAAAHEETRDLLRDVLDEMDRALTRRIARARDAGELAEGADPVVLARTVSSVLYTLAIKARAGVPEEELRATVQGTIDLVCGHDRAPSEEGRAAPSR